MKKLMILAAICGSMSAVAADIKTSGTGSLDLDAYRGRSLYVEFQSSPKLTTEMRQRFEALGYSIAATAGEADVSIKVVAAFSFERPRAKAQQIDFGKVVEQANSDAVNQKAAEATRAPGVELAPLVQGLRGNLSASMVLGVGLVDSILSMSGARGWFNKLVSGDERGVCLGTDEMCKDWKKYVQQMRLTALVAAKAGDKSIVRAEATAKDEELLPDPLFRDGMGELTGRLFPPAANESQKAVQAAAASTMRCGWQCPSNGAQQAQGPSQGPDAATTQGTPGGATQ